MIRAFRTHRGPRYAAELDRGAAARFQQAAHLTDAPGLLFLDTSVVALAWVWDSGAAGPNLAIQLCLNRVARCERLAEQALFLEAQENYLRIAAHWRVLAEHYDHIERTEVLLGKFPD